jgi:hypothetical protein
MESPNKKQEFFRIAHNAVLTGSIAAVGNPISVANLSQSVVTIEYTRNGASLTGNPIISVELSWDKPNTDTASLSKWCRLRTRDTTSYSSGAVDSFPDDVSILPSAATIIASLPDPIDVSSWFWLRVLAADSDAANPGTINVYVGGH